MFILKHSWHQIDFSPIHNEDGHLVCDILLGLANDIRGKKSTNSWFCSELQTKEKGHGSFKMRLRHWNKIVQDEIKFTWIKTNGAYCKLNPKWSKNKSLAIQFIEHTIVCT
jgi:hypothetical protein